MLQVRTLTNETEFEQFSQLYRLRSQGIPADLDFLRHGTTRVFTDEIQSDRWLAGYVINQQAPYRYLMVHTEPIMQALLQQHQIAEADIVEIGAIWMDLRRLGRKGRWEVYQYMMGDAYAAHRPIILGGTVHNRIRAFQMQVTKYPFFEGEVMLGDKAQYIWQYFARRDELWSDFFRATLAEFDGIQRGHPGADDVQKNAA